MYDVEKIRADFPILARQFGTHQNVYLDSAASAQKPLCVVETLTRVYLQSYANVHRGMYPLAEEMTAEYEKARRIVQGFINAKSANEVVFTRNATESINLVASSWTETFLSPDDEILVSEAEHHANLVPWQRVCEKKGCRLKVFKIGDDGSFLPEEYEKLLTEKTKLVAITAMSNVLGTIFPIKQMTQKAHAIGAKVLVDACQFAVHRQIDVLDLDADFLAFSGHKTYGPAGIGVLYAKSEILNKMPPYQCGGDMVDKVTYQHTTFAEPPARFEAGTPSMVDAIGLGAALEYMQNLGLKDITAHEESLVRYMFEKTSEIKGFKHIGTAPDKGGVFSFAVENIHPQDLAYVLGKEGVAIRIGHHCAEPLVERMGYTSLARASFGLYTNQADIDAFVKAVEKAQRFF